MTRLCGSPRCTEEPRAQRRYCDICEKTKKRYNITKPERDDMLAAQGGACAICESPIKFAQAKGLDKDHAVVDHTHLIEELGYMQVRGILCGSCNNLLGRAQDSATLLRKALDYVESAKKREI